MRKLSAGLLVALLSLGVVACGDDDGSDGSPSGLAFRPVRPGVLTVQTSLPAPGFWNGAGPSSLTGGLEYEMARDMAELLGLELRVENVEFAALVEGRTAGFDLALSQITKTPEREAIAKYSDGYFSSDQGVLVVRGTEVSTSDQAKALLWGVQEGTTSESFLLERIQPTRSPRSYVEASDLFAALLAGDVQAVLFDTVTLLRQAKQPGYENTEVVGQFATSEVYGALLPQDTENLATVNTLIDRFRSDGDIDAWADRYLPPEPDEGIGGNPVTVPIIPL